MAAPSGTVWGAIAGSYARLGIYVSLSNTATQTSVTVELWAWTKWSLNESANTLYFDNLAASGSATTSRGSATIYTTVESGTSWSTNNQVKIKTYTYSYTRGTSAVKRYLYAKMIDVYKAGTMYASTTFSVPALASYTVSYNANGGSGAPSGQTKWYGKSLTLSSVKPTRTGYSFQGWATSASGSVAYAAGASYTENAAVTLYAIWEANTYDVSYNANGGSGAPANQTKTYGVALALSATKPTRTNYNFLGWATSASATTAAYAAGGSYTDNAAITLYAVWELAWIAPRITRLDIARYNSATGADAEDGTNARVTFEWETDLAVSAITIRWKLSGATDWTNTTVSASGTSGSVNTVVGSDGLDNEQIYSFEVVVADSSGSTTARATLNGILFTIDFLAGGKGVAVGKAATREGLDVYMQTIIRGSEDASGTTASGQLIVGDPDGYHIAMDNNEIMAKENATTPGNLTINYEGGNVGIGGTDTGTILLKGEQISVLSNMHIAKGKSIFGLNADGEARILAQLNASNQAVFGYGGYSAGEGASYFDGNSVNIRSKGGIYITSPNAGLTAREFGVHKTLWSGALYMTNGHSVTLPEAVSAQPNGIVLAFSSFKESTAEAQDYWFQCFFIPKGFVAAHPGSGHTFPLFSSNFEYAATKYLYINNAKITGNANNNVTGTAASGITYTNTAFVLRYVFGV